MVGSDVFPILKVVRLFSRHALVFWGCIMARWWFQIFFIFTPTWGRWTHFDEYFSTGLVQPPTSHGFFVMFFHTKEKMTSPPPAGSTPQADSYFWESRKPFDRRRPRGDVMRLIPGLGQPGWGDALEVVIFVPNDPTKLMANPRNPVKNLTSLRELVGWNPMI